MPNDTLEITSLERRTPSQTRSRERRERILTAAKELVEHAGGVHGVTTRHIADRAGVPIGSVYYLFPNLQAIYYALFLNALSRARNATKGEKAPAHESWEQRIDTTVDRMMQFFWSTPLVSMLWRAMRADPELRKLNDADNARWEAANVRLLTNVLPDMSDERRRMMACVMVRVSECILSESLSTKDSNRRAALAEELKCNLRAYIGANLPVPDRCPADAER